MYDAFSAAFEQWSNEGVPANPAHGSFRRAGFKTIDAMRRRARFEAPQPSIARAAGSGSQRSNDLQKRIRTSVMTYRSAGNRNLRSIANALGVANVVEG